MTNMFILDHDEFRSNPTAVEVDEDEFRASPTNDISADGTVTGAGESRAGGILVVLVILVIVAVVVFTTKNAARMMESGDFWLGAALGAVGGLALYQVLG